MARGKYRDSRNQDDYYLSDRDLTGAYIDEMGGGGPVRFAGESDAEDDADLDEAPDAGDATPAPSAAAGGTFRQRLAAAIAPKPVGPRPARPPARSTARTPARSSSTASTRPVRGKVAVPEGKTIQDLINNLDRNERMISLVAAVLGVAFAIFVTIYYAHPQPHVKDQVNSLLVGAIIGVPSLLLGGSVFIGRRALVGFLALLTGFAMLTFVGIAGIVYFGVGLWLIMRAQRYARAAREESGSARPTREPRRRPEKAGSSKGGSTGPGKGSGKARPATSAAKPPPASKRYTPPRGGSAQGRRRAATS